jgi:organic radical activating enzyme
MSVKMSASGEPKEKRWKPDVVNNYLKNTKDSFFKFVLSKDSLKKEADEVIEFLKQVPTFGVVYCMPLGGVNQDINTNAKSVYEFALHHNFRYSDRIHIRIYDDLEGV